MRYPTYAASTRGETPVSIYITFPWLGVIVKLVPDLVYPESVHAGRAAALAELGNAKVNGMAVSKPKKRPKAEIALVNLLRSEANQVSPSPFDLDSFKNLGKGTGI